MDPGPVQKATNQLGMWVAGGLTLAMGKAGGVREETFPKELNKPGNQGTVEQRGQGWRWGYQCQGLSP